MLNVSGALEYFCVLFLIYYVFLSKFIFIIKYSLFFIYLFADNQKITLKFSSQMFCHFGKFFKNYIFYLFL